MRRLLIQSVDLAYVPYLALTYQRHATYAQRCQADYQVFTGLKDMHCAASWNKIALLLDGVAQGYTKLVWLDADCLALDLDANIFTETSDDATFQMCRYANVFWHGKPHYNAGVLVVNAGLAWEGLSWVWNQRYERRPHHVEVYWEQNWLGDLSHEAPELFADLAHRWNYHARYSQSHEPVAIQGWHGEPDRLAQVRAAVHALSRAGV